MTGRIGNPRIDDPSQFGKVVVLMGGNSAEREISLLTGQAVLDGLSRRGVNACSVDAAGDLVTTLQKEGFDRAWIALHGRGGEDGTIQGLLEMMDIPYTGSGVMGSAISMDKLRSKRLMIGAGLETPAYRVLRGQRDFASVIESLGLPLMVKPAAEGSSIGLMRVDQADELPQAFATAAQFGCEVFAEQWVTGPEYTAAILDGQVLPLIRIDAANTFYDYQAKYFSDETAYVCPCGLPSEQERAFREMAQVAFDAVGAGGWGRVDFMLDGTRTPLMLEVNTVPGLTSHSLVPMAAAAAGIEFDELVWRILETSVAEISKAGRSKEAVDTCNKAKVHEA
jgi:D-alanine-D-alanine ligase